MITKPLRQIEATGYPIALRARLPAWGRGLTDDGGGLVYMPTSAQETQTLRTGLVLTAPP